MNETIELLHGHRSDRDFTGEPIPEDQLAAIIEAGHRTPSHRNVKTLVYRYLLAKEAKEKALKEAKA